MVAYRRLLDEWSGADVGSEVVDNGRAKQVLPPRNLDTFGRIRLAALGASCGRLAFILTRSQLNPYLKMGELDLL